MTIGWPRQCLPSAASDSDYFFPSPCTAAFSRSFSLFLPTGIGAYLSCQSNRSSACPHLRGHKRTMVRVSLQTVTAASQPCELSFPCQPYSAPLTTELLWYQTLTVELVALGLRHKYMLSGQATERVTGVIQEGLKQSSQKLKQERPLKTRTFDKHSSLGKLLGKH